VKIGDGRDHVGAEPGARWHAGGRPGTQPLRRNAAQVEAKGRQGETEATSIRYVVETPRVGTDSERAIRWRIMLMVLRCGPLAIALTAAVSAQS
jgi:hypothetical protein